MGVFNVLDQQMTHVDVGSLRIDSFTNLYPVDWNMPAFMNRTIENDLRARGHYPLIPIAVSADAGWKQTMSNAITRTVNGWMPGDLKVFLEKAAAENRLDAIISVSSYDAGMWPENACFKIGKDAVVITKGYGLFTRTRALSGLSSLLPVGQNQAIPYANILVAVYQPQPATLASYAAAPCSKENLSDFPWDSDLQFLGTAVIRQVRPYVERLGAEAVQTAIGSAGLTP
jgi:hypothetical protein